MHDDKNKTTLGMNRTGIGTSPKDSKAQTASAEQGGSNGEPGPAIQATRILYVEEAESLGTIPPPVTVKGMAKTVLQALKGNNAPVLIDMLGERLAFERTGSRLYQALIHKYTPSGAWSGGPTLDALRTFREQELRHFHMLRDTINELGADPTVMTPSADVTAVASTGLLQVVADPRMSLAQSMHALLAAELVDGDSWNLLVSLTQNLGLNDLATRFQVAASEEELHLDHVRMWISSHALGESATMPSIG